MKESEVAILLALANGHDQRQGLDDVKVRAWFVLLEQEASDMTLDFGKTKINEHYARSTDMLMPVHLVKAWKDMKRFTRERNNLPKGVGTPMPDWFKEQMRKERVIRD